MGDAVRAVTGLGIGLLCAFSVAGPISAGTAPNAFGDRSASVPPASEPPPSEPTESESDDTTPDNALVGAGEPDDDIDTTVAVVAIGGFVALLAVASWWMVRRSDPDAEPMPPGPPPSELI
jgi:hypothetical protein